MYKWNNILWNYYFLGLFIGRRKKTLSWKGIPTTEQLYVVRCRWKVCNNILIGNGWHRKLLQWLYKYHKFSMVFWDHLKCQNQVYITFNLIWNFFLKLCIKYRFYYNFIDIHINKRIWWHLSSKKKWGYYIQQNLITWIWREEFFLKRFCTDFFLNS